MSRLHHVYFNTPSISRLLGNPSASRLPATKVTTSAYIDLAQGWATLFVSRSTLVTSFAHSNIRLRVLCYIDKNEFLALHFLKKLEFCMLYQTKHLFGEHYKCSRATLKLLAGRMWPANQTLPRPDLAYNFFKKLILGKSS